jgi:hypothetical protein
MTTITNDDGDIVTRINVMQIFSYDVEQIAADLLEDLHADDAVVTFDDVLERIKNLSEDDFVGNSGQLVFQDENGNDY